MKTQESDQGFNSSAFLMKSESEREIGVMRASGERDAMKEKYRKGANSRATE